LVRKISDYLERLESKLQANNIPAVEIRFPRGVIRTANLFRNRLLFIGDKTLRSNLAYHLMLTDIHKWVLNRLRLVGVAREMYIKEGITLLGNIVESIVCHVAQKIKPNEKPGFSKACTILLKSKIITKNQKVKLEWLWGMRCKEHLQNLKEREFRKYTLKHYNLAVLIWQGLENSLRTAKNAGKI